MNLYSNIFGNGQAFIFLHGFLGMGDNWKSLGTKFSENGYEVHLVDQRNHGRSFHSEEQNYEVMVADLKSYCDTHQLKDFVLLGHSMGGKTAMSFAVQYPELVSKLIVVDISPRYYPAHHDDILNGLSSLDFQTLKTRGAVDEALSHYVSNLGIRQFLLKNLYWKEKGVLALRINLPVLERNSAEVGEPLPMHSKFNKETLFLRGDRSEYVTVQDEALIHAHFPKSKIVTIANAGHWLHAENPADFYTEVNRFLNL